MLEFCLSVDLADHLALPQFHALRDLCTIPPERVLAFSTGTTPAITAQVLWAHAHPHGDFHDRVRIDDHGLRLLIGFPMDALGAPLQQVTGFIEDQAQAYSGDFFYLRVTPDGAVTVKRSPICSVQLYVAQDDDRHIIATRAGFVAEMRTPARHVSAEFTRWVGTYAVAGSTATIHDGVRHVLTNQDITIDRTGLSVSAPDHAFLHDATLADMYRHDPKLFWDETFDRLVAATRVLEFSDAPFEFSLSGGKDSRLLLGLILAGGYRDRLARVFTNGPAISPEVRSAALVCGALGLPHETVDTTNVVTKRKIEIDRHLPMHAHITEAEMSPYDLTWSTSRRDVTQLHGQEIGMREISGTRDISDLDKLVRWFEINIGEGDRLGVYRKGVADQNRQDVRGFVDAALSQGVALENVPTLHRTLYRHGRWIFRTWRNYNDRWFAPYLFVETQIIQASFNSGRTSRQREEFHFEMLRRMDDRLIDIPFAAQTWAPALVGDRAVADPLGWERQDQEHRARPSVAAFMRAFCDVQAFVKTHDGAASRATIDPDRFAALRMEDVLPSHYQSLWQLMQVALFERIPDLAALGQGASVVDFGLPSFDFE